MMLTTTVNWPAPASMTTWAASGACRDSDPELFFPVTETGAAASQLATAKAVCAGCPVRDQCLQFAVDSGQAFGVWGGTTGEERRRIRRRHSYRRRSAETQTTARTPARAGHAGRPQPTRRRAR